MTETTVSAAEKFKLHSASDLFAMPEPKWLIDGVMEEGAFGVLYGPSQSGKSFLALDWALCAATSTPWQGRAVTGGPVVYVAGEGAWGVARRVRAWMQMHKVAEVPQAFFVVTAPQMVRSSDRDALLSAVMGGGVTPRLIVLDTLARCFGGTDENSSAEMGAFVSGCDQLKEATGAAVLVLHHTGKSGETERGSSALGAAADVMVAIKKEGERRKVANTKQKNAEEFPLVWLRLEKVESSSSDYQNSCVMVACEAPKSQSASGLSPAYEAMLLILESEQLTTGAWRHCFSELTEEEISHKTFDNWRKYLVREGLVVKTGKTYSLTAEGEKCVSSWNVNQVTETTAATMEMA